MTTSRRRIVEMRDDAVHPDADVFDRVRQLTRAELERGVRIENPRVLYDRPRTGGVRVVVIAADVRQPRRRHTTRRATVAVVGARMTRGITVTHSDLRDVAAALLEAADVEEISE